MFWNRSPISQAPNVAQLASEEPSSLWAKQFIDDDKHAPPLAPFISDESALPLYEPNVLVPNLDAVVVDKDEKLKPVPASLNDFGASWGLDFEKMKTFDDSQFGLGKDWVENFLKSKDDDLGLIKSGSTTEEDENGASSKVIV